MWKLKGQLVWPWAVLCFEPSLHSPSRISTERVKKIWQLSIKKRREERASGVQRPQLTCPGIKWDREGLHSSLVPVATWKCGSASPGNIFPPFLVYCCWELQQLPEDSHDKVRWIPECFECGDEAHRGHRHLQRTSWGSPPHTCPGWTEHTHTDSLLVWVQMTHIELVISIFTNILKQVTFI